MNSAMKVRSLIAVMALVMTVSGCAAYKSREVSFRHPSSFANMQNVSGAMVAAASHADKKQAEKVFGFDIRATGILPVQVVIDNAGAQTLQIVPAQTFLIDGDGNLWNLLRGQTVYERLEKSTEYARIVEGGGKGAVLGAAGGALIGAAIGVLTGENVGTALAKGAAVGGAGGRPSAVSMGGSLRMWEGRFPGIWPTRSCRTRSSSQALWPMVFCFSQGRPLRPKPCASRWRRLKPGRNIPCFSISPERVVCKTATV